MLTNNTQLNQWIENTKNLCNPSNIHLCDGSEEEYDQLIQLMVKTNSLHPLNDKTYPGCYLYRSAPNDVARTEHLTYICTKDKNDAGPNNNWLSPEEAHAKSDKLFKNSMNGRTMYIIPYCMGPYDSPYSRYGVEITDSPYVVINMRFMTRMGKKAQHLIEEHDSFVKGLHCTGDLSLEKRMILHFPEEMMIKSFSSGYGGNALLGKKCHALRLASWQARKEGWLAEHMLILGIESPEGHKSYVAAAFPSACGKTNLAMLIPPEEYKGWKIWTVGDDIAWMHPGKDGRLYAINPEAGFFGVAPGTSEKTNPNAVKMLHKNTLFTNVALNEQNEPWWEGKDNSQPTINWLGKEHDTKSESPAAHPNARFTVSSKSCASYTKEAENPEGVPISAIIFGGRRSSLVPLVLEAKNWNHGVLLGVSVSSQTTAAATGQVGVLRHDPMAMKPFCGYHFGKYWKHWIDLNKKHKNLPQIYNVNWFRKNDQGQFIWPGFKENIRVLEWIIKRTKQEVGACSTPLGNIPLKDNINTNSLDITKQTLHDLCSVQPSGWNQEIDEMQEFLSQYKPETPKELWQELGRIKEQLNH